MPFTACQQVLLLARRREAGRPPQLVTLEAESMESTSTQVGRQTAEQFALADGDAAKVSASTPYAMLGCHGSATDHSSSLVMARTGTTQRARLSILLPCCNCRGGIEDGSTGRAGAGSSSQRRPTAGGPLLQRARTSALMRRYIAEVSSVVSEAQYHLRDVK